MQKNLIRQLPNFLSVIRFPLGCLFAVLLVFRFTEENFSLWSLPFCFATIALSDFFDGQIARHWACQSHIGEILDVTSDSFFILLSLILLNFYHIIPIWFTTIVILKLMDFILSSRIFSASKRWNFVFDFLGRMAAVGFYVVPVLAGLFPHTFLISAFTYSLALVAILSSILRWAFFAWHQHT
ncbi:MAG TPA: CDP-alcohol phosphatidyltransferase family protein [Oscillospiraceae bacterium]|nr:CDP-alcohol phosphatidyltransferase family protein [Oscillospiraceae bacterium]